jgi:hypothetical protein
LGTHKTFPNQKLTFETEHRHKPEASRRRRSIVARGIGILKSRRHGTRRNRTDRDINFRRPRSEDRNTPQSRLGTTKPHRDTPTHSDADLSRLPGFPSRKADSTPAFPAETRLPSSIVAHIFPRCASNFRIFKPFSSILHPLRRNNLRPDDTTYSVDGRNCSLLARRAHLFVIPRTIVGSTLLQFIRTIV